MIGEVISIGDEMTSGQRLDTNSQWLSQQLGDLGVNARFHTTVADDLAANVLVFRQAAARADVIVASGGLGPTADDLTREALAQVLDVPLELDAASLEHIEKLFQKFRRPMPERNRLQAMFPRGARPIANPSGTAPGIDAVIASGERPQACRVFALPGVPAEMKEMFAQTVAPQIAAMNHAPAVIRHRRLKCFGVGESQLEQMLPDMIRRGRQPSVGITVHEATITLRITARGSTDADCEAQIAPTRSEIMGCLGDLVFGEEEMELEDAVIEMLAARRQTVATAEGFTAGLLAQWLALADRGRSVFAGGWVLPGDGRPFAGPASSATPHGTGETPALGDEAVVARATEVRRQFMADIGLAVSGRSAQPAVSDQLERTTSTGDASTVRPADGYFLALATADNTMSMGMTLGGHPAIWLPRAAKQALNMLRLHLLHAAR